MPNIIRVWGDSLLKGVVFDELRNRYAILKENCIAALSSLLPCTIENNARMGCTAAEGIELVEEAQPLPGALALIEFGGNDCDMQWAQIAERPYGIHEPNTPLPVFIERLEALVRRVRDAGMMPALAIPTPLHAQRYFDWVTRGLDRAAVLSFIGDVQYIYRWQESYAHAVSGVANRLNCALLDLRTPFLTHPRYEELLCVDGMHPNADGHKLMLRTLAEGLPSAV